MDFADPANVPLDFRQTLDRLASWEGQNVEILSCPLAPGEPMSHTMTVLIGELGKLQMVDNAMDAEVDSVAAFSVGPVERTGFYVSPADFERAQPLGEGRLRLDFRHNYSIRVALTA